MVLIYYKYEINKLLYCNWIVHNYNQYTHSLFFRTVAIKNLQK